MPNRKPRLRACALLCVLSLAACGGGADGPGVRIRGIYSGNIQEAGSSTNYPTLGVVAADGYTFFFSTYALYAGSVGASGDKVGGSVTTYPYVSATSFSYLGETGGNIVVSGAAVEGASLNGNLSIGGTVVGSYALNYDPVTTGLEASRAIIAGTWGNTDSGSGYGMVITIDSGGVLSGSDSDGCNYAGTIDAPATGVNIYRMGGTIACPGEAAQAVTGAVVRSVNKGDEALLIVLSNAAMAAVVILVR